MSIEFDFQLTGSGWCEAYISDGERWLRPTASHLSDAPTAFLSAVVAVLRGHSPVACFWSEEPGEYVWIFIRHNGDVELRILWHDDWISQPSDSDNWFTPFDSPWMSRPDSSSTCVSATCVGWCFAGWNR